MTADGDGRHATAGGPTAAEEQGDTILAVAAKEACKLAELEEGKGVASIIAACTASLDSNAAVRGDAVRARRSNSAGHGVQLDPKHAAQLEAGERRCRAWGPLRRETWALHMP